MDPDMLDEIGSLLNSFAEEHLAEPVQDRRWSMVICSRIAAAVAQPGRRSFAAGVVPSCDGGGWLFDFCTLQVEDTGFEEGEILGAKLLLAGEIELNPRAVEIVRDLQKLLVADCKFGFFIYQQRSAADAKSFNERLERAARDRQDDARRRGLQNPPSFLLSCFAFGEPSQTFIHSYVRPYH